jgi:hypothetical protein
MNNRPKEHLVLKSDEKYMIWCRSEGYTSLLSDRPKYCPKCGTKIKDSE